MLVQHAQLARLFQVRGGQLLDLFFRFEKSVAKVVLFQLKSLHHVRILLQLTFHPVQL